MSSDWQLRGCLGDEWKWHVGPDKPWDAPGWLPARVPGSVLDDLMRAGEVPNLYFERNSRLTEWVPERSWVYRTRLDEGGVIRFEGVDYACTVFLDGEPAASHEGLFTAFEVDVRPGLLAVVVNPAPASEPQVGSTSHVRVHKPRMNYGWDFCPRLVHQGIWRPVVRGAAPPPVTVALKDGVGVVRSGGDEVRVESPEPWWPNGMGEPRLYDVVVGGREVSVGFRTVELDDYALVVNGVRTPIRGWNWCPLDALYGVPRPGKLAHFLELAARAHVNLLRVWGGGLIETEEFYAHCDRLGLLVWQEFSQSSSLTESVPSSDPEFVERLRADARAIVPSRAHHPSLAIWCGGNELDADDSTPALAALRESVDRAWLPTSPFAEDVHGPWEHQGLGRHTAHYDSGTAKLHSEFGVEGMTNRRALEELIAPEHRWPADRTNPVYEHLGAWWNNAPLVQECFGGRIEDVDTMRRASQWLQYEGLRYAVEANIRRGAGTIPWQLNESYPNAWCTAAVDWHGGPKPAYYGVARAYRPGHPSASFATWAWAGRPMVEARLWDCDRVHMRNLYGEVVAEAAEAPLDAITTDVFIMDLADGANRYVMTRTADMSPLLDLPVTQVDVDVDVTAGVHLYNRGEVTAIGLVLEDAAWTLFDDNVIDLLPGESRTIGVRWAGEPELRVEGWNVRA